MLHSSCQIYFFIYFELLGIKDSTMQHSAHLEAL
jgi:hypothetical protein